MTVCSSRHENTKRDEGGSDACVLENRRESRLDLNPPVSGGAQPLYANAAALNADTRSVSPGGGCLEDGSLLLWSAGLYCQSLSSPFRPDLGSWC